MISVLYVDDENTLLEVTRVYLERTGDFSVTTCMSATDALALLKTRSFDAIVSDYQMPVMDGLLFLRSLRDSGDAVPFILFTGKGREQVAIEALNTGADFYLQKGGEPKSQFAELMSKIRQAVQRRQAEIALTASEEKYRDLVESINDVIFAVDQNSMVTYISPRIIQFGYTADQVVGKPISDFIVAEDLDRVEQRFEEIKNGVLKPFEFRIRTASGETSFARTSSRPVFGDGRFLGVHGLLSDISAEKSAEAKAMASEKRYRNVFEASGEAMLVLDDGRGVVLDANPAALALFSTGSLKGVNHADLRETAPPSGEEGQTEISATPLWYYRKGDGTVFPASVLESTYPQKRSTIRILSIRDLTLQKRAEERMLAAQRLYAVLSQINQAIVRMKDLETLLAEICRISVGFGHFRMSWVGLLDRQTRSFRPVAHAGHEDGYLRAIEITVAGDERSRGPTGTALREGRSDICNDIGTDPRMEPWRNEALKRGYRSSAAIPFRLHGEVVGAYMIYASRTDFFNEAEIALLEEIALDISFALDMLDEQARRSRAEQALAGSEERAGFLAMVLELSSQPFGVAYPDGRIGIVNPAFCDLVGYTEAELRQLGWKDLTPPEHHEHESAVLSEAAVTGTPQRYEKEFFRKDGTRVPVELFVHRVVDNGGNLQYFTSFVTDITERRRIGEALRAERDKAQQYLDTAGVMLAVLDTEGTITLINRKGCGILGYTEDELLGRNWIAACLPDAVRREVQGVFDQIVRGDIAPVEYHENPVRCRDGGERILAFHNTLLRDRDGGISGILFSGEDITERKAAERALFESEERFRNLIQNASDMIRIIGTDGLIAYSSPSTLRITGLDPGDLVGKDPLSFIHPDDRERVQAALGEVYARTNPGTPTEYRIRHADGSWIDVEAIAANLIGTPGIDGIVTTTRVITERKKAEQALLESEGRYRAIFEKSADAIFVLAETFLDCNPEAERLFGCSRASLNGLSPADLSPPAQPDGRPSADLAREYLQSVRGGVVRTFDWVHMTKDGRPFPASVTLIPARVLGQERVIAIVHDRSAEVHDVQRFRHLARFPEMNPDPVIEVCRDREIRYANPAAKIMLRRLGMPEDPQAFLPEDFDAVVIAIQAESAPSIYREVRVGTALFGETLSYDPEESTIRIFARDVTTRTFEKEAIEQANHKLNLLSHITRHDIKNKLTGVMGYLELARGSARDPELIEYLSRAEISANAIRQQVEFTKEYENLGVKAPGWHSVSALLERAVALLDRGAVTIQDETCGLVVYADPMIEKVLYCLLENALSHGQNLTRIRILTRPSETGCLLVVEDDGVGVPAGFKEKIFAKKVGKEGGLGLFLSREILGITGITIAESGAPGEGARFELGIPSGKFQIKSPE